MATWPARNDPHRCDHPGECPGADRATTQDKLTSIREWFGRVQLASLELPHGWFGRPYDNLHQLTWSSATSHKILLELDHQILVIVTDPGAVEITQEHAELHDCLQVTLDWQEYGNMRPRLDDYGNGNVTLHSPTSHRINLSPPSSA